MKKATSDSTARQEGRERRPAVEKPDVRALLDHLASELAEEYVRLMTESVASDCRVAEDKGEYR